MEYNLHRTTSTLIPLEYRNQGARQNTSLRNRIQKSTIYKALDTSLDYTRA